MPFQYILFSSSVSQYVLRMISGKCKPNVGFGLALLEEAELKREGEPGIPAAMLLM
jgi:hypothetical protein